MTRLIHTLVSGLVLLMATSALAQSIKLLTADSASDPGAEHVAASLISQSQSWQPGTTVTVGLRLKMDDGWHTYWKNPGDAGLPTSITWDLPEGYVAHEIDWPGPHYFETSGIGGYGYTGDIVLPVRIDLPADAAPGPVTLKAAAKWLECAEVCIPGKASLELTGTVSNGEPQAVEENAKLFAVAAARQPKTLKTNGVNAKLRDNGKFILLIHGTASLSNGSTVRFFPDDDDVIDMSAKQGGFWESKGTLGIRLSSSKLRLQPPERLTGVVVIDEPDSDPPDPPRVWRIDVPVETP